MTTDNTAEGTDNQGESTDDSSVIQSLRSKIRELEKQVKSSPSREDVEAELRAELERESAIADQLVGLGHPKGMAAVLKSKLGESDVTRESVAEALAGIGYQVEVEDAASEDGGKGETGPQSDLAKVSELSAKVRSAAQGEGPDAVQRLNQASSQEELAAIAAELGITQQHV